MSVTKGLNRVPRAERDYRYDDEMAKELGYQLNTLQKKISLGETEDFPPFVSVAGKRRWYDKAYDQFIQSKIQAAPKRRVSGEE